MHYIYWSRIDHNNRRHFDRREECSCALAKNHWGN